MHDYPALVPTLGVWLCGVHRTQTERNLSGTFFVQSSPGINVLTAIVRLMRTNKFVFDHANSAAHFFTSDKQLDPFLMKLGNGESTA